MRQVARIVLAVTPLLAGAGADMCALHCHSLGLARDLETSIAPADPALCCHGSPANPEKQDPLPKHCPGKMFTSPAWYPTKGLAATPSFFAAAPVYTRAARQVAPHVFEALLVTLHPAAPFPPEANISPLRI